MSIETDIVEIPGLLRNKIYKILTFTADGLKVEKPLSFDPIVFIPADTIASFRYGVKWIRGYKFIFGRQYIIEVQDKTGEIFSVKLTSLYQIRRKAYSKIWSDIFNQLFIYYFKSLLENYYSLYKSKQRFDISSVEFHPFGIRFNDQGLFWNEIALSNYKTYFMIHDRENIKKLHRISFMNDWNAFLLQRLLKKIIEEQNSFRNP